MSCTNVQNAGRPSLKLTQQKMVKLFEKYNDVYMCVTDLFLWSTYPPDDQLLTSAQMLRCVEFKQGTKRKISDP